MINLRVNGNEVKAGEGTTVAAILLSHGFDRFRRSVAGEVRGPLCGMGICFECRVTIDGVAHQRSCTVIVREGMEIVTDE
ncbi:MAG: (2Fe-2S)-binding protein [Pyrinomonadaceae bacterium]|nr:(2Fe-2S)-binding protein [Pyrinomonadaceae bacterium]